MAYDERKRKKKKDERPSYSSPDAFKQDKLADLQKQVEESHSKDERTKLAKEQLKKDIQKDKEKSKPEKEKQENVMDSQTQKTGQDAGEIVEKIQKEEDRRKSAMEEAGDVPTVGPG